jgi:hypothetical protein
MAESQQPQMRAGEASIRLYDEMTGEPLMEITPEELRRLQDALEEEFLEDHDYYINRDTLDYLFARGVDARILDRLGEAMGARDGFEILWHAGDQSADGQPSGSDDPEAFTTKV